MGGGSYSTDTYSSTVGTLRAAGKSHGHSNSIKTGKIDAKAHELLDPKFVNKAGKQIRECFDSDDHPNVTPIVIGFDLTGSNAEVADISQDKIKTLYGILQRRGICEDPAICVAGYGDAYVDKVPLQVSQFEASNAIDTALDAMYLENGGGGNGGETATLLWYFLNRFVEMDSLKKRGKKGYFVMIADECALPLKQAHIRDFIHDVPEISDNDLAPETLAKELQEKFDVTILQVDNHSARDQNAKRKYVELFGEEHVIDIDNPENMIETIAALIGAKEETLNEENARDVLIGSGASEGAATTAITAVAGMFKGGSKSVEVTAPDLNL